MKTFVVTGAIAGLAVLAAGTAAFAQSGGQLAVAQGTNTQTYDVPAGSKPQTVIITTRDLKDGEIDIGAHASRRGDDPGHLRHL